MTEPDTPALRALQGSPLRFDVVRTQRARSAEESASLQGIELGQLLRTIVVRRGAITPFGSTTPWPLIADATIPSIGMVAIGGGGHGINLHVHAEGLLAFLSADVADVTKPDARAAE